jgi:hypothetical protein
MTWESCCIGRSRSYGSANHDIKVGVGGGVIVDDLNAKKIGGMINDGLLSIAQRCLVSIAQ